MVIAAITFFKAYWKPLAIVALVAGFLFFEWRLYKTGVTHGVEKCEAQKEKELVEALLAEKKIYEANLKKMEDKGKVLETQLQKTRSTIRQLNQRVQDEIDKNPVYIECKPTPTGVRLINEAIRASQG